MHKHANPLRSPSVLVLSIKRACDIIIGTIGTATLVLLYPFIALLIQFDGRGPVIYSQIRIGLNRRSGPRKGTPPQSGERRKENVGGRPFVIYKFRTMRVDAEANGPQLCSKGADPRLTSIGKWLRALHLDELPQFVNIFKGDMSFVGPRPERPHFTLEYQKTIPHYSDRTLFVRPGLTGMAQIVLGYDDTFDSVVRKSYFDLSYGASLSNFGAWLKMERWIYWNTVSYLIKPPNPDGGEVRKLDGLARAKQLPFKSRSEKVQEEKRTIGVVRVNDSNKVMVLGCNTTEEIDRELDRIRRSGRGKLEVSLNPAANFDLEDFGFLVNLVHRVQKMEGRISIRNPHPHVQKMLKEVHLDKIVEMERVRKTIPNFMTVDVECWFHAYNLKEKVAKCNWHTQETRVVNNVQRILGLMDAHQVKGTFFVLGWVADRFPEVVERIAAAGHEIGTHGYYHNLITEMTPDEFEADLVKSIEAITRYTSQPVLGHRGSNFTVTASTLWALEVLRKHGLEYDSSIFPINRGRYGIPNYPNRMPHRILLENGQSVKEFPMSTLALGKKLLPISGGGYLRLYPYRVTDRYIEQMNASGFPAMVYFHPWELDTEMPNVDVTPVKHFQHYVNLSTTEWKLSHLMERFKFTSIRDGMKERRIQNFLQKNPVKIVQLNERAGVTQVEVSMLPGGNEALKQEVEEEKAIA